MPYAIGDKVTVRFRAAPCPGTVEGSYARADGPRVHVRISEYTVADVAEDMLAPRGAEAKETKP